MKWIKSLFIGWGSVKTYIGVERIWNFWTLQHGKLNSKQIRTTRWNSAPYFGHNFDGTVPKHNKGEQNSCQTIYCARKQKRASISDVGSYLKLGGAQPAPSGWNRVGWSAKTWVGNCPPCPPISYVPVYWKVCLLLTSLLDLASQG